MRLGELPDWMPAAPEPGCLTAHEHDPDFKWQANFQVRGDLVREDGGWSLVPHKFVGGFELAAVEAPGLPRELQQDAALPQEGEDRNWLAAREELVARHRLA